MRWVDSFRTGTINKKKTKRSQTYCNNSLEYGVLSSDCELYLNYRFILFFTNASYTNTVNDTPLLYSDYETALSDGSNELTFILTFNVEKNPSIFVPIPVACPIFNYNIKERLPCATYIHTI